MGDGRTGRAIGEDRAATIAAARGIIGSVGAKLTKAAVVLVGLTLAACQSPPPRQALVVEPPRSVGPARGIDIPTDASDVLSELKGSGLHFIARYYREPTSRWPGLSSKEVERLAGLGLKIVTVWESYSHNPEYFSYASGYSDGQSAHRQANAAGQTPGSAIYFAVDYDVRAEQLATVQDYFRGVAAGMAAANNGKPDYKIGVYGSGTVCAEIKGTGLAQYSWLSNSRAWSGSRGYSGWDIKQGPRTAELSFNHDMNEARDEYGAFQPAVSFAAATPPPAAPVVTMEAEKAPRKPWLASVFDF